MRRCSSTTPAVVVGAGGGVALGIIRDLGYEGVPVVAMGPLASDAALRSRYCVSETCGLARVNEERVLADLVSVGARIGRKAVLFAAEEDFVAMASRHKAALEEHFIVPMLGWERMRLLIEKEPQLELAQEAGVEIPATAVIRSAEDLAEAAEAVPFPALLKPSGIPLLRIRTGLKVIRVDTRDQLSQAYERISFCGTVLLQEVIPGPDDAVLLAGTYHDADSRPQAVFTGRKLRQHPRGFGNTRAGESLWSDELADVTLKFLAAVPYHGLSDIEFKRDARDGRLKFMEINARQGLWSPLARAAGVNLAYIAYRDAIGQPCQIPKQIDGVRWTDMLMDGPDSLKELWRGELRPAEWMASLRDLRVDCFLSARDPLPGLVQAQHIVKSHIRRRLGQDHGRPPSDLAPVPREVEAMTAERAAEAKQGPLASSACLRYPDLGAMVYPGWVPEGLADELPTLYGSLLSTLDWFLAQDHKQPNGACVLDEPRHVLLLRHEDGTVDVLNKAFACGPAEADRICRALFRAYPEAHRIHLDVMFPPSGLALPWRVVERQSHLVIDLPATVEEYYLSLGKSTRRTIRSYRNKLERAFPDLRTEVVSPGERSQALVDRLIDWKVKRFREQNRVTYWETRPELVESTANLLRRCGESRITYISGKEAAIHLCFRVGDTAYALEGAHDPQYDAFRLGFLTMYETVCAAIESGAKRFNALEGTAGPKMLLGAQPIGTTRLSVFPSRSARLRSLDEALRVWYRRRRSAYRRARHALGQKARRYRGGDELAQFVARRRIKKLGAPERESDSRPSAS